MNGPPLDYERHPEDEDFRDAEGCRIKARNGMISLLVVVLGVLFALVLATGAFAHTAISGTWTYPPGCCRSAAEPGGDCAVIDERYVVSRPDGYHINLPKGAHPKLINKGYVGVVPYRQVRPSPDGAMHICLSHDGGTRYCFFAMPPGV